jgi:catechol 2,3-dioxygenase
MTGGRSGRILLGMKTQAIHPAVRVGHVHLRVTDVDRALGFYRDALGFLVGADAREVGLELAFLHAGDYHCHVALSAVESIRPHSAFIYPDRRELARAVRRLVDHGCAIDHASDHGATVSVYLADPDGNVIELYHDRPRADWFDASGRPVLKAERFDWRDLLETPNGG